VTEITRDDKERVLAREVRREDAAERLLLFLVDGSDKNWDNGDFFPDSVGGSFVAHEHLEAEENETE
jgi:hypothetical protein